MAHTPGPWRVHSEHADRIIVNGCCVYQVRDMTTGDGYAGNGYGQPSPVDVRLMAAAPDLLAALKMAKAELIDQYEENYPDDESDNDVTDAIDAAIAAIAKAEGRTDDQ